MAKRAVALALLALAAAPCNAAVPGAGDLVQKAIQHHVAGRLTEAQSAYQDALADSRLSAEQVALVSNNLCVLLPNLGRYQVALPHCLRAVEERRRQGKPVPLARALNNLAIVHLHTDHASAAGKGFSEALSLNQKLGLQAEVADNLTHLGLVAEAEGRYSEALDLHRYSQDLAEDHSDQPWAPSRRQTAIINQGVALERLGQYRPALKLYRELLQSTDLDSRPRARLLLNTAALLRNLQDPIAALETLDEAESLFRELDDLTGLVDVALNRGLALRINLGRGAEAEREFKIALSRAREAGDRPGEIRALFHLGDSPTMPADQALDYLGQCLHLTEDHGHPEARASALAISAQLHLVNGDFNSAIDAIQQAMDQVESIRRGLSSLRHRGGFFRSRRDIYSAAIEIYFRRADQDSASQTWLAAALAVAQRAKERQWTAAVGSDLVTDTLDFDHLVHRLKNRRLLEFWSAEPIIYLFDVRGSSLQGHRIDNAGATVFIAVQNIHRALSSGSEPEARDLATARRLLPPQLDLGDSAPWLIAPDLGLSQLPFEILPLAQASEIASIEEPRLVDHVAVSYLPTASALNAPKRSDSQREFQWVGLGDPVLSAAGAHWLGSEHLPALPHAARELQATSKQISGRQFKALGPDATEIELRRIWQQGADIFHIAAHAMAEDPPGRGAALFLSANGAGPEHDGLMTPEEVAAMRGSVGLTVLAACQSALTTDSEVGALGSIAGAFLAAGSEGTLAGLWSGGDQETAVFMEEFYRQLSLGARPADALTLTKRRLRSDPRWNRSPLWASWVLWGDPSAPVTRGTTPMPAIAAIGSLLAGVLWLMIRRRRRGQQPAQL